MIRVFYGEDRVAAQKMVKRQLGENYEVIEAETLQPSDMASLFLGTSLFGETRTILVKDLSSNKECWDILPKFIDDCSHNVVIWESKLDKRSVTYKELNKNKSVEFKEFAAAEDPNKFISFRIFDAAVEGNTKEALRLCGEIDSSDDAAFLLIGSFVSQAVKKLQMNSTKAPKILKILAQADMDMKSTGLAPWQIVKMAIIKIGE